MRGTFSRPKAPNRLFRYTEENEIEKSGVTLKQAAAEGTEVKYICI